MRQARNSQMILGEIDIASIRFNEKCRDDIPRVLRGLQYIYINEPVREEIFGLLKANIQPTVDKNTGRPGMDYWTIFVMGVLRLGMNWDYDALQEQVNEHGTIRQMLGHADDLGKYEYQLQTIKDNVKLFKPELLDKINEVVVKAGHALVKKKDDAPLKGRIDSFVVETNVHYPTDTNLLFDALRVVIRLIAAVCVICGVSDWRQHAYNIRQVKRLHRKTQRRKGAIKQQEAQMTPRQAKQEAERLEAFEAYLTVCQGYLDKARLTLNNLEKPYLLDIQIQALQTTIEEFMRHADRQIDQIRRRVLQGEVIPHAEKVFSLFEPHTEWVVKGKAGVPVELGVRVCIVEDQHQFILHHRVMEKQTDDQVALSIVEETKLRFPLLRSCSFDKGFHSPDNQTRLSEVLDVAALPRKGKLSQQARVIESSEEFLEARHKHSAVESAINALEVHGLDICPDHGIHGFKRYVSLAVLARNIHRIGCILNQRDKKRAARKNKKIARTSMLELLI